MVALLPCRYFFLGAAIWQLATTCLRAVEGFAISQPRLPCTTSLGMATQQQSVDTVNAMDEALVLLNLAADSREEDSDKVLQALEDLEKLSRKRAKEDTTYAPKLRENLNGAWRLIFTTGTKKTQEKGGRINYFPIKAVQSFTQEGGIENGIYLGDFCVIRFSGNFAFDQQKRRVEFDFNKVQLVSFLDINLKPGEAASLGSKSGLGSESNVANSAKKKLPFFNWISADATIATARGGGGGLALWRRVDN